MPFKLTTPREEATVEIPYAGESVTVTYRRALVQTWALNVYEADTNRRVRTAREALEEVIVAWDVVDDDDQPLPATQDVTRRFPTEFLMAVLTGICQDATPGEAGGATSRPSLPRVATRAGARKSTA